MTDKMPPAGRACGAAQPNPAALGAEASLGAAICSEVPDQMQPQSMFLDEIDAARAGQAWLDARRTVTHRLRYSTDRGSQAPRLKWAALTDAQGRIDFAYMLTRDELNWTQLVLVDAAGDSQSTPPAAGLEATGSAWLAANRWRGDRMHASSDRPEVDPDVTWAAVSDWRDRLTFAFLLSGDDPNARRLSLVDARQAPASTVTIQS